MSEITSYSGGALGRDSRRASREIQRGRLGTQVSVSRVGNATDLTMAKLVDVTYATGSAMQALTKVAQAQQQLEQMAPAAAGRLEFLVQDHAFGCADLLGDLRRGMRRIK